MLQYNEVKLLDCDEAKEYLRLIIEELDLLDEDDYFGTEGWRHSILGED